MTPYLGEAAALGTAFLWGIASLAHARVGRMIGAFQLNLLRLPLSVLMIGAACLIFGSELTMPGRAVWYLAASGVIGLAVGDTFLYASMVAIGPRLSILIYSLAPASTALLAVPLLGESLTAYSLVGILVTLAGVVWVVSEQTPADSGHAVKPSRMGLITGVLAMLSQSVGVVLSKVGLVGADVPALSGTFVRMSAAVLVIWLSAAVSRRFRNPVRLLRDNPGATRLVLAGAVCGPFVGVWFSLVAVKYAEAGVAATLIATEPVMLIPMLMFTEGYKPTLRSLVGVSLALAGSAMLFMR